MKKFYLRLLGFLFAVCLWAGPVFSQEADYDQYKLLIEKNAGSLGITAADARDAVITKAYTDEVRKVTYVYLQQAYQRIKVYNTFIAAAFIDGVLQYSSGLFVKDIAAKAGNVSPSKAAATAVQAAASHLQLAVPATLSVVADQFSTANKITFAPENIARRDIDVTLYWAPSDDKQTVRLTWNVNIDVKGSDDWWNVRIDAQTGTYVQKDNWTVDEHPPVSHPTSIAPLTAEEEKALMQSTAAADGKINEPKKNFSPQSLLLPPPPQVTSATYRVIPFPVESPAYGSFANVVNPWMMAGGGNNAITFGWHFDGVASYNITRGNNVFAFLDRRANNVADAARNWPDTSTTPIPSLTFVHNLNTAEQPFRNTENKKAAIDNLFYWNNLMHDVMYQYGLTEAAGNFQNDNMSRGGAGNDFVMANAQDSAGYNNANFSTPTDGTSGRMQMYTFSTAPTFVISSPAALAGLYTARENSFTAPNKLIDRGPVTGQCVLYNDDSAGTVHNACATTAPANASALAGKIVLIDATTCTFISKVKKAQTAGAIAVMEYYPTILGLGGTDATVTIPTVSITTATANAIIAQLNNGIPVTVTLIAGIYLDGDLDNGVICHEYGHGVSNRLTGGPYGASCLGNAEQGGEGWSDYLGLMMTTNWSTATVNDGPNPRPVGAYVTGDPAAGIRRYPYSTNLSVDPLTYANMATSTEVHNIGEIWCSTVWDMTWNIIQQQGSITPNLYNSLGTGGNVIALNLVMMGMKLQPCSPGFLDARDAILAADSILYGYAHKCAIWNAFARRGMGYSAVQGLSTSATDQTAAFDLPGGIQITKALPVNVGPTAQVTLVRTATCDCQAASYTLRDTIPPGFTYISSSPLGTLNGNVLTFPSTAFTAGQSQNFAITLRAPAAGCPVDYVLNDNRESTTVGGFASSGTNAWTTSTVKSHTPTAAWYAPNITTVTSASLTSAPTAATAQKPFSILSFWHNFRTETGYDGGIVEYSTNGGATWIDAAPLIIRNGYNNTMFTGTALSGRRAFTGNSKDFQFSMLNLSSLGTTPVSFRFRMETDNGVGVEGWYVDDIVRANGCGDFLRTGIYDGANARRDSAIVPLFIVPSGAPLPLTLLNFNANPLGSQVALDWKTESEINVKDFTVEWSADAVTWGSIGNAAAFNRAASSYGFIHSSPVTGNNYYRIRMNDRDGRFTYSAVRLVNTSDRNHPMVVLAPNPVSTDAVLYISKEAKARQVQIYDAAGSLVRQLLVGTGIQQVKISVAQLADGVYTVETNGAERYISRMIVKH